MKKTLLSLSIIATLSACDSSDDKKESIVPTAPTFSVFEKVDPTCEPVEIPPTEEGGEPTMTECDMQWTVLAPEENFTGVATKQDTNPSGSYRVKDANPGESIFYGLDTTQTPYDEKTAPIISSKYGQFFFSAGGEWNYFLWTGNSTSNTPEHDDVTNLVSADSIPLTDEFTITTADGTQKTFVVTIKGIDEDSEFSGAMSSFLTLDSPEINNKTINLEDANPVESDYDTLITADGRIVDLAVLAGTDTEGSIDTEYGMLTFKVTNYVEAIKADPTVEGSKHQNAVKAKFVWGYKLNPDLDSVKKFYAAPGTEGSLYYTGEPDVIPSVEEKFTLTSMGAMGNTEEIIIAIEGSEWVPAVVTGLPGVTEGEGESAYTNPEKKVEINDGLISGSLNVSDANLNQGTFQPLNSSSEGLMYGSISIDSEGAWLYGVDLTKDEVKALKYNIGEAMPAALVETVTVTTFDGTTAQFNINIEPSEQLAPIITDVPKITDGKSSSKVDVVKGSISGKLNIVDENPWEASFQEENIAGIYGLLSIDASGNWTYTLNNDTAELIESGALALPFNEMIEVTSYDGTRITLPISIIEPVPDDIGARVHAVPQDLGRIAFNIPAEAQLTGKMTFKLHYSVSKDSRIMLQGDDLITNNDFDRALIGMTIRNNKEARLYNGIGSYVSLEQKQNYKGWTEYEFTWDASPAALVNGAPVVSVIINGEKATKDDFPGYDSAEDFDYPTYARQLSKVQNGAKYLTLRSNSGGGVTGAMVIDDLVIYSDVAGNNEVYRQTFDSLKVDGDINDLGDLINDRTHGVTTIVTPVEKP
ncbi:VCBS domain-containing protein [Catenovulum maritimum]|nr:VCBS domain-containing protein [Catenovulum maritimum]